VQEVTVKLNKKAVSRANGLIRRGQLVHDERDDWSKHAPTATDENQYIKKHGIEEYAKWFLGEDTEHSEDTKGRYLFPYGDFEKIHRCAVISGESRAGQYDHAAVERAEKDLLTQIDKKKVSSVSIPAAD
jgi:hypothetical protein